MGSDGAICYDVNSFILEAVWRYLPDGCFCRLPAASLQTGAADLALGGSSQPYWQAH